jgi:hypothetical protein
MSARSVRSAKQEVNEEEEGGPLLNEDVIEKIAKSYNTAFKGLGTDEARVIRETVALTNRQRQQVEKRYVNIFGLVNYALKNELKFDYEKSIYSKFKRNWKTI